MEHQVMKLVNALMGKQLAIPGSPHNVVAGIDIISMAYDRGFQANIKTVHGITFGAMTPLNRGMYMCYDMRQTQLTPCVICATPQDTLFKMCLVPKECHAITHDEANWYMTWQIHGIPRCPTSRWALNYYDLVKSSRSQYLKALGYDVTDYVNKYEVETTVVRPSATQDFLETKPETYSEAVCYE